MKKQDSPSPNDERPPDGGASLSATIGSADFFVVTHDAKGAMKRYRGGMYLDNAIQHAHDALCAGEQWLTIKRNPDV